MNRQLSQDIGEGVANGYGELVRLLELDDRSLEGSMHILLEDLKIEPLAIRAHATLSFLMGSPFLLLRLQAIPESRILNRCVEQLARYVAGFSHTPPPGISDFMAMLTMSSQAIHALCTYVDFRKLDDPDDIARSIVALVTVLTENGYVDSTQCILLEDCLHLIEINFDANTGE